MRKPASSTDTISLSPCDKLGRSRMRHGYHASWYLTFRQTVANVNNFRQSGLQQFRLVWVVGVMCVCLLTSMSNFRMIS